MIINGYRKMNWRVNDPQIPTGIYNFILSIQIIVTKIAVLRATVCLEYVVFYSVGPAYQFGFSLVWFPGKVPQIIRWR